MSVVASYWCAELFDGHRIRRGVRLMVDAEGRVAALRAGVEPTANDARLEGFTGPALVDLQANGAADRLFNAAPTADTLRHLARALGHCGVGHFLPTLTSDGAEVFEAGRDAAMEVMRGGEATGVLGVHFEGPFLALDKRGAHPKAALEAPGSDLRPEDLAARASRWRTGGHDLITVAPERVGAAGVAALIDRGFVVSLGHTLATYDEAIAGLDAGAACMTHFFNAMSPLMAREGGAVGAGLAHPRARLCVIADGHHIDARVLALLCRWVDSARLCLVSDAMPTVGGGVTFELGGQLVRLVDGRLVNEEGRLAGAHLRLIDAVRYMVVSLGVDLAAAWRMASAVPAQVLGLGAQLGTLEPGARASLLTIDRAAAPWLVRHLVVDGRVHIGPARGGSS